MIGEAVTLSHVVRPTVLASALQARGYDVTLACDPRYSDYVGTLPLRTIPIRSAIDRASLPETRPIPSPIFDVATLDRYIAEDRRLMRAVGAEVVVGDMRQSLAVSARQACIPFINLIDAQFSPFSAMEIEMARPSWMPRLPQEIEVGLKAMLHPPAHFLMTLPANLTRMRHGIEGWHGDAREVYGAGDHVLYPDIPEIVPIADLPPRHHYIGPIRWSPSVALPPWWNDLPQGLPIVFVNISASSPRHLLPACLEALAEMPVTVIAAGNGQAPQGWSGKLFVVDILPGREAAERADLTICNGGNMSVQQSLLAGTPVLCLPQYAEQLMYSRAIAATGAGTRLDASEVGTEAIRQRVTSMLNEPSHRDAARALARVMDHYDAGAELARLIGAILAERAA